MGFRESLTSVDGMKITASRSKNLARLPAHVAIVPDGNGRWAERRGLPRLEGHRAGVKNMRTMVEYLNEYQVK
ncbi:MAG: undecaprenyl diphosphate synthase family protein, partial [Dehalococcoidales bacterium]|nr:undecaprenyl diphosphate synthase family protein [Dehalococcoidales bacterium]